MSVLNENTIMGASAAGGYEIEQSLKVNDGGWLSHTPSVAGNRKTWTFSCWLKVSELAKNADIFAITSNETNSPEADELQIMLNSNNVIRLMGYTSAAYDFQLITTQLFRDVSAWYHIAVMLDTTQATASDRLKLYVNGAQVTDFSTETYPALNHEATANTTFPHKLGKLADYGTNYLYGYLAEVNFIDGLALTPDSFGETGDYGEWKPLKYTGAYGTNGFYLDFADSGDLGNDVSGNTNDWTPTNLAATDQMLDSPTNNFATLNPLDIQSQIALSEGNLKVRTTATGGGYKVRGTQQLTGKVYFEGMVGAVAGNIGSWFGIADNGGNITSFNSNRRNGFYYNASDMRKMVDGAVTVIGSGAATAGDVIGLSFDLDNNVFTIKKNNVALLTNQAFTDDVNFSTIVDIYRADSTDTGFILNFGQDSSFAGNKTPQGNSDSNGIGDFYYAPPAGFLALCTQNLPEPTVIPSEHFNTVLWAGSGADQSITGVGFQSDFTWIKPRNVTGSNALFDSVRGVLRELYSNTTGIESVETSGLNIWESDGFHLKNARWDNISDTYVAWNWKANGTGVSNTDGTITSTVSANVEAGFSIISYTGTGAVATVGHGLSIAPEMIIVKNRISNFSWITWHTAIAATDYLLLNSTAASATAATVWNSTAPSSSVFSLGSNGSGNESASTHISYCFHSVDGYSKVGSYTGNGSFDGTFVHTGFNPRFIMMKRTDSTNRWVMMDSERDNPNEAFTHLWANISDAETAVDGDGAGYDIDFLSNGFKQRNNNPSSVTDTNKSGGSYIFIAFAESPFKHSNAR